MGLGGAGLPATGHRVEPLGEERCRLRFDVPVVAAPYLLVTRAAVRRIARMAEAEPSGARGRASSPGSSG